MNQENNLYKRCLDFNAKNKVGGFVLAQLGCGRPVKVQIKEEANVVGYSAVVRLHEVNYPVSLDWILN